MDFFIWGYFFPHPIRGWRSFSEVLQFNSRAEKLPFDWRPLWGEKSGTGEFAKITPGVDVFFFFEDFDGFVCCYYVMYTLLSSFWGALRYSISSLKMFWCKRSYAVLCSRYRYEHWWLACSKRLPLICLYICIYSYCLDDAWERWYTADPQLMIDTTMNR